MRYFARVTAGLEQIAWLDIEQRTGAKLLGLGHRRIDFTHGGPPDSLLTLRSVDDVYVFVTALSGFDCTRASLAAFQKLKDINFLPALNVCSAVRSFANPPTYSVTASYLGTRNYSRFDIESAVQAALPEKLPWRFVPNRPEEYAPHDIEVRILLEDNWAIIGLRLGSTPLHRRPYKVASLPGSLKAPVAYCLCRLAGLKTEDKLLDPTCGAGTILIEAAAFIDQGVLAGIDIDANAIIAARKNSQAAGLQVKIVTKASALDVAGAAKKNERSAVLLCQADARDVRLPHASLQAVVTNPPWGNRCIRILIYSISIAEY